MSWPSLRPRGARTRVEKVENGHLGLSNARQTTIALWSNVSSMETALRRHRGCSAALGRPARPWACPVTSSASSSTGSRACSRPARPSPLAAPLQRGSSALQPRPQTTRRLRRAAPLTCRRRCSANPSNQRDQVTFNVATFLFDMMGSPLRSPRRQGCRSARPEQVAELAAAEHSDGAASLPIDEPAGEGPAR